jgi:integrase
MRYSSLCRITESQVDASRQVVRDPKPKGKRSVEVRVGRDVLDAALRCAQTAFPDDGAQQLDRRLKIACAAAGVARFTAHDLRVSGATHLHREGVPLRDLQLLLGHAELRTTERYVRAFIGAARGPELEPVAIPSQRGAMV